MYKCVCVCACKRANAQVGVHGARKRVLNPVDLDTGDFESPDVVFGTKLSSSTIAASIHND